MTVGGQGTAFPIKVCRVGKTEGSCQLRFCLVGYGSIAGFHREALAAISGVSIQSVVGRLLEPTQAFAQACGASLATVSLEEALSQPGLDAVLITSPSQVHYEQTVAALNAGKHVLLEIPMGLSLAEATSLVDLAEAKRRTLMICHTQRYWAASQEIKRRIGAGEFKLHHYHVEWHFFRRKNVNWVGRERSWKDSILWHHGGHVVDHVIWLFGESPDSARAHFGPPSVSLGIPLDMSAQLRFPGGGLATLMLSYNAIVPKVTQRITLIGEEDYLVFEDGRLIDKDGNKLVDESNEAAIPRQNLEFVESVREGREPLTSAKEMSRSYEALDRLEKSALV